MPHQYDQNSGKATGTRESSYQILSSVHPSDILLLIFTRIRLPFSCKAVVIRHVVDAGLPLPWANAALLGRSSHHHYKLYQVPTLVFW